MLELDCSQPILEGCASLQPGDQLQIHWPRLEGVAVELSLELWEQGGELTSLASGLREELNSLSSETRVHFLASWQGERRESEAESSWQLTLTYPLALPTERPGRG